MGFYEQYLRSLAWQEKRHFMLGWAGGRCQQCGYSENLEVHHRTYDRLGNERIPEDLEVLCSPCHALLHNRAPKAPPIKNPGRRLGKGGKRGHEQARVLDIALRDAYGRAVAAGESTAEIERVARQQGKGQIGVSRSRRKRKRDERQRDRQRLCGPPAEWES